MKKIFTAALVIISLPSVSYAQVGIQSYRNTFIGIGIDRPQSDLQISNINPALRIDGVDSSNLIISGKYPTLSLGSDASETGSPAIKLSGINPEISLSTRGKNSHSKITLYNSGDGGQLSTESYLTDDAGLNLLTNPTDKNKHHVQLGISKIGAVSFTDAPDHPVHTFIAPNTSEANVLEVKRSLNEKNTQFSNLMVIDKNGNMGINTSAPTARLHSKGSVRFEDLPVGAGDQLVIDAQGNISRAQSQNALPNNNVNQASIQALEAKLELYSIELRELKQQIQDLNTRYIICCENKSSGNNESSFHKNDQPVLFQSYPNPANTRVTIPYYLPATIQGASIIITDEVGKIVYEFHDLNLSHGNLDFDMQSLIPGNYLYSLIINHKTFDTKKIVLFSK